MIEETTEATHSQVCSVYPEPDISALLRASVITSSAYGLISGPYRLGWARDHRVGWQRATTGPWLPMTSTGIHASSGSHTSTTADLSDVVVPVVLFGERLLGVLNIQTQERHVFTRAEVDFF